MTFDTRKIYDITSNDSLQERAVLRAKYFEKEGYRKLSDILPDYPYVNNRDNYMLARYITGRESTGDLYTEQIDRHKETQTSIGMLFMIILMNVEHTITGYRVTKSDVIEF